MRSAVVVAALGVVALATPGFATEPGYPPGGVNVVTGETSTRAVAPGQAVSFRGDGFRPGSVVRLSTEGAPVGELVADPRGVILATVRPKGAAGEKVVAASGVDARGRVRVVAITVQLASSSSDVPNDGGELALLALLGGFGLVTLGAGARVGVHRRRLQHLPARG